MILGSCYSFQGKSHKKNNIICQDASVVKAIAGDWTVMATADGVGSCPKSDIGSRTAVEVAAQLCVDAFPMDGSDEAILSLIRTAFNAAMREISKIAKANNDELSHYDTTLDVVIFNGSSRLYYGHCGDGGIFVLNGEGDYTEITVVQEGEEASSVIPLRNGNSTWEFGVYEDTIAVVASFTDGIRDKIASPLLKQEKCKIDVPLANKFMFVDVYGMSETEASDELQKMMKESVTYLYNAGCGITDDVTMGILVNTDVLIKENPEDRYEKPDWVRIWSNVIEDLYPTTGRIFKRHQLEVFITDNPDRISLSNAALNEVLDRYYPLSPAEAKEYQKKYEQQQTTPIPSEASISPQPEDNKDPKSKGSEISPLDESEEAQSVKGEDLCRSSLRFGLKRLFRGADTTSLQKESVEPTPEEDQPRQSCQEQVTQQHLPNQAQLEDNKHVTSLREDEVAAMSERRSKLTEMDLDVPISDEQPSNTTTNPSINTMEGE